MQGKPATAAIPIHDIIKKRWSPRAFDPDKDVADKDLLALLEAARWAPSCYNDQPWRYVVCVKSSNKAAWQAALACLTEKNQQWAGNAPVLMLVVAMDHFSHNGNPNRWAVYDAGAASLSLCLQAVALGLVTHQMAGFDAGKASAAFGLPADCTPLAMLAIGYQAAVDATDEGVNTAGQAVRSRAPLAERFYSGQWGAGFKP